MEFDGRSENGAPIIGAAFWKKGVVLTGRVTGVFQTSVGECYNLTTMDEITVPGNVLSPKMKGPVKGTDWSIGALKGFEMAVKQAFKKATKPEDRKIQLGDQLTITCIGLEQTTKGNPRVDFHVRIRR